MKKNGFTLIELLIVIIILSIIATFSIYQVSNTRNSATDALIREEKKNIEEAAKIYAIDLEYENGGSIGSAITVNLSDLISEEYLEDTVSRCTGSVIITKNNGEYNVDTSNVTCKKN